MKNQKGFDDGAVGSRIGFKGAEDLGNGLKAEFQYELGIAPTNNINQANITAAPVAGGNQVVLNNLNTRNAWVALTSATIGQIAMGRFQAPGWDFQANARPWGGVDPIRSSSNVYGMNLNSSDRISNSIQYTSPTFSGFKAKVLYSADFSANADLRTNDQTFVQGVAPTLGTQQVYYVSGYYDQGPISGQLVYRHAGKTDANATENGKYEWGFRGAYDFGVAKVGASYQMQQLDAATALGFQKARVWGAYVTVPIGPSFLLTGEYGQGRGDLSSGSSGYMINGQYLFSKRTSIYVQGGTVKMKGDNAGAGFASTNLGSYGSTPIEAGHRLNGFMAGLLHTF